VRACAAMYPEIDAALPRQLVQARQAAAAVDARQLQAEGLQGAALGEALRTRRLAVLADL
jgi:hypothetical protein